MLSLKEFVKKNVLIIAEIGNNHDSNTETAKLLIDISAKAGVDAVKFQTFTGKDIVTPLVESKDYKGWEINDYKYWHEFIDTIALSREQHIEVFKYAESKGLIVFSTPTSPDNVDFLESLNVPMYKIASMDMTNIPLLKRVAKTGKPVIVSTGMSNKSEIDTLVEIFKNNELALLHCISDYPTNPDNVNLKSITYILENWPVICGFSDHAIENEFAIGSVALGGRIIEKHVTYNRNSEKKAEHHFSLEPHELESLVNSIRLIEKGLGEKMLKRSSFEEQNVLLYRRSLHLNKSKKKGEIINEEDISILRPNIGADPKFFEFFIGKRLSIDVNAWSGLTNEMIIL